MSENERLTGDTKPTAFDAATAAFRGAIGMTPVVGPLVAELAGVVIPDRRLQRISDVVEKIGAGVSHLQDRFDDLEERFQDEHFGDFMKYKGHFSTLSVPA